MTITPKQITDYYLYGQSSTPVNKEDDNLIRNPLENEDEYGYSTTLDMQEYMASGAGRFALPYAFDIIQTFFTLSALDVTLMEITTDFEFDTPYSVSEIADFIGGGVNSLSLWQANYADSSNVQEYAERVYIYNFSGFKISEDAKFVITQNDTRYIDDLTIRAFDDNYDFAGGNIFTDIANVQLEDAIDPSTIGQTVEIKFSDGGTALNSSQYDYNANDTYDRLDYIAEQNLMATWQSNAANISSLQLKNAVEDIVSSLWDNGTIKFLDSLQRPIIYGTIESDDLNSDSYGETSLTVPHIDSYINNGVVLISGKGSDVLTGGDKADRLLGGADKDQLNGGKGDDALEGGAQADTYIFEESYGKDVVVDSGLGDKIIIKGAVIQGKAIQDESDPNIYRLENNTQYSLEKSAGSLFINKGESNEIELQNWVDGDYGIKLVPRESSDGPITLSGPSGSHIFPGDRLDLSFKHIAYELLGLLETPLTIDIDGDGIELTSIYSRNFRFDMNGDGFAEYTGWVDSDDGFLVADNNSNGVIDNQTEMFGATNAGLSAWDKLAAYDSNSDGKVDSSDANWSDLLIWKDVNQNGYSEASELFAPNIAGIYGFDLSQDTYSDEIADNIIDGRASWLDSNGNAGGYYYDTFFRVNQIDTEFVGNDLTNSPQIDIDALIYPEMRGQGTVHSLTYAASNNEDLSSLLDTLLTYDHTTPASVLDSLIFDILYEWSGAANTVNVGIPTDDEFYERGAILKAFYGGFASFSDGTENANYWEGVGSEAQRGLFAMQWDEFYSAIKASLLVQTAYAEIFPNSYYSPLEDKFLAEERIIFNDSLENILSNASAHAPTDPDEANIFWSNLNNILEIKDPLNSLTYDNEIFEGGIGSVEAIINAHLGQSIFFSKDSLFVDDNETGEISSNYSGYTGGFNPKWLDASQYIYGSDGNNTLIGGKGDDYLNANDGDDLLVTTYGADILIGGDGADIFRINPSSWLPGSTSVIIGEHGRIKDFSDGTDKIDLSEFAYNYGLDSLVYNQTPQSNELNISYDSQVDLTKVELANGVYFTLEGDFSSLLDLSDFIFPTFGTNNAESLNATRENWLIDGMGGNDVLNGASGAEYLIGGAGNDTFYGGESNDTLFGGAGNDVYFYEQGLGNDTIRDWSGDNIIYFESGISYTDITISFNPNSISGPDIVLEIAGGETLTLSSWLKNTSDSLVILEDRTYTQTDWQQEYMAQLATDGDDYIMSYLFGGIDDIIYAKAGNDTVEGYDGNDALYGEAGNDDLWGQYGDDTLHGGDGSDTLSGGYGAAFTYDSFGADTFVFYLENSSEDVITDFDLIGDMIDLSDSSLSQISDYADLNASQDGDDVLLTLGNSHVIRVQNVLVSELNNSSFIFYTPPSATEGNDTLQGGDDADLIYGLGGNDEIYGGEGNDTINSGTGDDYLVGGAGDDVFLYGSISDSSDVDGIDYIGDFTQSEDKIDVSAFGYTDVTDFAVYQDSGYTEYYDSSNGFAIGFDTGTLTLTNSDFIFA